MLVWNRPERRVQVQRLMAGRYVWIIPSQSEHTLQPLASILANLPGMLHWSLKQFVTSSIKLLVRHSHKFLTTTAGVNVSCSSKYITWSLILAAKYRKEMRWWNYLGFQPGLWRLWGWQQQQKVIITLLSQQVPLLPISIQVLHST